MIADSLCKLRMRATAKHNNISDHCRSDLGILCTGREWRQYQGIVDAGPGRGSLDDRLRKERLFSLEPSGVVGSLETRSAHEAGVKVSDADSDVRILACAGEAKMINMVKEG
jgi:hypothetical protein